MCHIFFRNSYSQNTLAIDETRTPKERSLRRRKYILHRFYFQQFVPWEFAPENELKTEEEPAGDRVVDPSLDGEGTLAMKIEESMEGKEEMGILEMPLEMGSKRERRKIESESGEEEMSIEAKISEIVKRKREKIPKNHRNKKRRGLQGEQIDEGSESSTGSIENRFKTPGNMAMPSVEEIDAMIDEDSAEEARGEIEEPVETPPVEIAREKTPTSHEYEGSDE